MSARTIMVQGTASNMCRQKRRVAAATRQHLDLPAIYRLMGLKPR